MKEKKEPLCKNPQKGENLKKANYPADDGKEKRKLDTDAV